MKIKLTLWSVIGLLVCYGSLFGQSNTVSSGGTANGSAGSATYTVGQAFYLQVDGNPNYLIEGMQQPYEVSEHISVQQFDKIAVTLSAYPNPTKDILTLSRTMRDGVLSVSLFDVGGKEITRKSMSDSELEIAMAHLAKGTYYLNVSTAENQLIKSFKILKN